MYTETDITKNLMDAGCSKEETSKIIECYRKSDRKETEKLIAECRKHQLEKLHEAQQHIDRLDFLSYQLERQ